MAEKNVIFNPSDVDHGAVIEDLVEESSPRRVFLLLIVIASVIATLGLLNDSTAIVIGAMLVAPILWPALSISMGLLLRNWRTIKLSLFSLGFSLVLAVVTAIIITLFYVPLGASNDILEFSNVAFMLPVAIAAGAAAAFSISYERIKEAVSGVAISVALLPPLVSIGIGLGATDWNLMLRSIELFFINLFGIVVTAYVIFLFLGFHKYYRRAEKEAKEEEKLLKKKT